MNQYLEMMERFYNQREQNGRGESNEELAHLATMALAYEAAQITAGLDQIQRTLDTIAVRIKLLGPM